MNESSKSTMQRATAETEKLPPPSPLERVRLVLGQIAWGSVLIGAVVMAIGWCSLFMMNNILQILSGIVPVTVGLFLGRKVKQHVVLHGLLLGSVGFVFGLLLVIGYGLLGSAGIVPMPQQVLERGGDPVTLDATQLLIFYIQFSILAMIPFPTFGVIIAHRNEQKRRELDAYLAERGGQLESPGVVRTLEDLQGLSLPQFGTYVKNLFVKNGFSFKDYRFHDKDKYLDLILEYQDEQYLLRLSVADTVRRGTIETLVQDMHKAEIPKGIVIASTEFAPDVKKSVKGRSNILLIDGQTLFAIAS